jgi:hypothetical protein
MAVRAALTTCLPCFDNLGSMDAIRNGSDTALTVLETAADAARSTFASMFLTVNEAERARIRQRRAEGRYDQSILPVLMFVGCATAITIVALLFD